MSILTEEPKWVYPKLDLNRQKKIEREFKVHPLIASFFVSRGFSSLERVRHFLYARLPDLDEPSLFSAMESSVECVVEAIEQKKKILIYGDNDVDGMTGVALLVEFLTELGGDVEYVIFSPLLQRYKHFESLQKIVLQKEVKLLITVDCGITSAKSLSSFVAQGTKIIITDHHEPLETIPKEVLALNPKLPNQPLLNRDLTGVGVAFKLAHGITNYLVSKGKIHPKDIDLRHYLDLVALGTISDMGILLGENRIFVRYGLQQLQKTKRVGLLSLFSLIGLEKKNISALDVALKIAPRINSLGRISDPLKGLDLFLITSEEKADCLVKEIDVINIERQKLEQLVFVSVDKIIRDNSHFLSNKALVLSSPEWHPRVIPTVAAKMAKQYNRPVVIIAVMNGEAKGSIRSIKQFPLLNPLKKCEKFFINYGGHDFASGIILKEKDIEAFAKKFIHLANSSLRNQDIETKLFLDAEASFKDLTYDLLSSLELLEPFGNDNSPPIFYSKVNKAWGPKSFGTNHLKLYLEQEGRILEGIAFGLGNKMPLLKKNIKQPLFIAYTPQINRFYNKNSIQLLIRDIKLID